MSSKSEYYRLAPVSNSASTLDEAHTLTVETQSEDDGGTCGTEGHSESETIVDHLESLASDIERVRRQSPTGDYIVELAIVNDNRQYIHHGRDLSATVQNALDVVNAADLLYRPLGVRLVVVHAITWTSGDRINVVTSPNTLLENIRIFKRSVSQPHDALVLITGIDLSGSTVGIAYLNTMCGSSSVGVVQDGRRSTSSSASTFAHEIGHVFNLNHDTGSCSCNDRSGRCVMAAVSGFPPPEKWSSCSTSQLQTSLTRVSNNLGRCLANEPLTTVGDPVCGNGIREGDEVCDCGSPQECDDPCCNPRTCRPSDGAQCTKGECCTSTCQFKAYGTSCRSSSGECDIEEYCSGESSECPVDVYRQDATSCNNNQAYCYSGVCQTYDDQCQYHFGSDKGVNQCYDFYNTEGNVFGNCGYTSTDYIACDRSDTMCGQLFCQPGDYMRRVTGLRVTIVTVGVFVGGQRRTCKGFTPDPGADIVSPGLVKDGTKCRDGHLCYNQRCTAVANVPGTTDCPQANGRVCSGRGVCNNRGQCSCNVGFVGSACERTAGDTLVNECETGQHNCDQVCVDTEESFFCTCNSGFTLASDGRTCNIDCGGRITVASGSFASPGYPNSYPEDGVKCEWTIEIPNRNGRIEFTIDDSAYGINGRPPCTTDHIEFFDGTADNAVSLEKMCGLPFHYPDGFQPITTSSSRAKVVFTGSGRSRPASRIGVRVTFRTVTASQNECQNNNGGCAHICTDTAQSFECSCREGFRLGSDQRSCIDVNECNSNNGGCQHVCVNTGGSFRCTCNSGFTLNGNQRTCSDINECTDRTHNCQQRCTNTVGSFTCSCNNGFSLDSNQQTCTENPTEPPCGGRLTAASGNFQSPGWPTAYPQENLRCEWIIDIPDDDAVIEFTIDDSAFGINGKPPCTNDYIEFFDGVETTSASIDKTCRYRIPPPLRTTSSVARVVFVGSINPNRPARRVGVRVTYRTVQPLTTIQTAPPSTTSTPTTASPTDVNECLVNNGGCNHVCTNTADSFECSCNSGFTLGADRRTCIDINECSRGTHNCAQQCTNTLGSFTCSCNSGFRLANDRRSCNDINECSDRSHNCQQQCTNTAGSFTCSCNDGFSLDSNQRTCTENPTEPPENGCGGRLTAASGNFQSPGWPTAYPQENLRCEWIIDIPDDDAVIEFTIDESAFGINGRIPCTNDYIEFFDGVETTSASIDKTCQYRIPPPLRTTSSRAKVVFVGSINPFRPARRVGVRVTYRTVQPPTTRPTAPPTTRPTAPPTTTPSPATTLPPATTQPPVDSCGGRLTAPSGTFQTEGWPNAYRLENFECEWIIELPDNNARIEFTIDHTAFGIVGRAPNCRDGIEFFDGTSSNSNSLQRVCGLLSFYGGSIQPIRTNSSRARVVFNGTRRSNRPSSRVGVRVTYRTI